jgi:predicted RNA-binding Zn-ribbon protein involved in translation (DUF1610 family)
MITEMTREEWEAEGSALFGPDRMAWRFVCPVCGHVTATRDWKDAGAPETAAAFSCVGRWLDGSRSAFEGKGPGPCDYSGGGLFRLNPLCVDGHRVFDFDRTTPSEKKGVRKAMP